MAKRFSYGRKCMWLLNASTIRTAWSRREAIFGAVLTLLLMCASLSAQVTSGSIMGNVKDSTGAVISGATVRVHNEEIGFSRTVVSSDNGTFVIPGLRPATYSITVQANGFRTLEKTAIVLSAADKLNAGDFVLEVGSSDSSVTVSAEAGQLQLQNNSGERSDVITGNQLNNVAVNGRNVLDYLKLIPGSSGLYDGHRSGTGGIDSFNINGTRANQHEFTIDGASNIDTGNNGGTHVTINTDAIEEVKILTSNYQAEFGKAAGGQIAITTKSGTNSWHGNGRFFHRHEGLNANEYFNKHNQVANGKANTPPLYRYNYIGYQLGGPVKKDKLFVFWSQEYYRQLVPIGGTSQFYTPTGLERNGDFSQSTDENGHPVVVTGPGVVGNKIDVGQLPADQQAVFNQVQKILNLYPEPNVSGFGVNGQKYNYSQSLSGNAPRREDILRVDYQINGSNRLFGRWIYNSEDDESPFLPFPGPYYIFACSSAVAFSGGCTQHHPGWNLSANLVSTITPTILNEFSVGPSHTLSIADGANGNISRGKNGIDLALLYPINSDQAIPDMKFGGLGNVAFEGSYLGATPWKQANTTINVNDNVTWVRNAHTYKFGLFYQRSRKDQIAWGNINGQFEFGTGTYGAYTSGSPLASALLGYYQKFSQSTARPTGYFRYNQLEFYTQDTWKVNSRLTLDYGVRFAWIPPQTDALNQLALFDPASYDPAKAVTIDGGGNIVPNSGDPLNGMLYANQGQVPDGGWNSRGIMPEPRFGFALDLFNDHKTVLRGGFGMMHDRVQGNLIFSTVFNNPALVKTGQVGSGNIATLSSSPASFGNGVTGDKNIVGADRSGNVPTVYSYSLGIQRELGKGITLDVSYVGSQSRHLVTSRDINAVPYGFSFTRAAQDPANFAAYCAAPDAGNLCTNGLPQVEPNLSPIYANAGYSFSGAYAKGHPSYSNAALVPYKGYGQIAYLKWDGTANYNSMQVSVQRRFSKGLTFGGVYTYSKSMTTANSDQDYQDPFDPRGLDYRTASWDRTHVVAINYVWDLPKPAKLLGGPKWVAYLTDNYQLSGIAQFMTGTPVDLNNGWSWEPGTADGGNMWGAIPYYYTLDKNGDLQLPPIGTRVRGTRDIIRTGGMQNFDMSLFKNIPIKERYSVQLRLEAFNVFNHPNFQNKYTDVNVDGPWQWNYPACCGGTWTPNITVAKSANWGQYKDTYNNSGGPGGFRVVQLGAKFYF